MLKIICEGLNNISFNSFDLCEINELSCACSLSLGQPFRPLTDQLIKYVFHAGFCSRWVLDWCDMLWFVRCCWEIWHSSVLSFRVCDFVCRDDISQRSEACVPQTEIVICDLWSHGNWFWTKNVPKNLLKLTPSLNFLCSHSLQSKLFINTNLEINP